MVLCYNALAVEYDMPIVVSTHPRTREKLEKENLWDLADKRIIWHKPFGLIDYVHLQINSFCVVSDSGTIHEDASILNFPAIAIRKSTEKSESIDVGHCIITGLKEKSVLTSVKIATEDFKSQENSQIPVEYDVTNVASKIARLILGMNEVIRERVWGT